MPSVVFAEASWYGSLRGGMQAGGGSDAQFFDGGSRKSYYFGDSHTTYRHGNAVSYAFSSGALGFQLDLVSDGGMDSGSAIDKVEFGMTVGIGEMGKIGIAHTNMRDTMVEGVIEAAKPYQASVPTVVNVTAGTAATVVVGTPTQVTAGTAVEVNPGTPVSVTPGTPGSYDGGTPGTLPSISGGTPYEPAVPAEGAIPQIVWNDGAVKNYTGTGTNKTVKTGALLETAKGDDLKVGKATVWVVKGTNDTEANADTDSATDSNVGAYYSFQDTGRKTLKEDPDNPGQFIQSKVVERVLLGAGLNNIAREGGLRYTGYHVSSDTVDCRPSAKDRSKNCVELDVYVNETLLEQSVTYDDNVDTTAKRVTSIGVGGKTLTEIFVLASTFEQAEFGYPNGGFVSGPVAAVEGKDAKAGEPATIVDGTAGTPPSYTAGTPTAVEPNTPTAVEPNTPTAVEPNTPTAVEPNTPTVVEVTPGTPSVAAVPAVMGEVTEPGYKATHVAVEFNVGGMTPHLGYSQKKMNGSGATTKAVHYGLSGSMGDTGMSYALVARNVKSGDDSSTPWLVNVSRGLGGGATVIFEYGDSDDGNSGKSRVGLHVNF